MGRVFGLYVIFVSACVLLVSMFVPVSLSSQPPIDTTTFYEGAIGWGPSRADPARAYDTGSGELIFNCYETLIAWNEESYYDFVPQLVTNVPNRTDIALTITNTSAVGPDPAGSTWTDGANSYTSMGYFDYNGLSPGFGQGDVIYMFDGTVYRTWFIESLSGTSNVTLNLWRGSYTFHIRTSPTIYFWNETGAAVDTFDVDDAEYCFKRGLVQDQTGSPQWMFYKPLFGTMNSDPFNSNTTEPSAITLANLIDSAVEKSGNDLIINLGIRFPDNAFKQILCNTYGSIVSKEFSISIGCWNADLYSDGNGDGYPDWWTTARKISRSPYDTSNKFRYCGTGPYRIATFNQAGNVVIMQKNPSYWRGWPAAGSNSSLDTIEIDYIADWTTRKNAFLSGAIDTCAVPRAYMFELLQAPNTNSEPVMIGGKPVIKTIKNIVPTLSMDAIHFTFTVDPFSNYIGTGHFPDGIPTDFFNNTHVRKAFAYSFNTTQYTLQAWYGEADYRKNWLANRLYPDYYNDSIPGYDIDYAKAEAELKAAVFPGGSVWNQGFSLTLLYNEGNDQRRIACEMTRAFFNTLSTYDGRVGNPFTVNVTATDWPTYLDLFEAQELPISVNGWHADFADADDFARPYMYSNGYFASFQNYTAANGWGTLKDQLTDTALLTPDGPAKAGVYQQLAQIYYDDCPSYPLVNPRGRRWCQYWVKGWYYNALYPSSYFYTLWKQDNCWFDASGPTIGVSDGVVNMRDIQYLLFAFNAKAPQPGVPTDARWNGNYGANGGVDVEGNRLSNMRGIQGAILHFNHKNNTLTP
jgi:peptide/nickel transport system substrate-binding protein